MTNKALSIIQDLVDKQGEPFPPEVIDLIDTNPWRTAKSEWWPHQYILRDWVKDQNEAFTAAVEHLQRHGFDGQWFEGTRVFDRSRHCHNERGEGEPRRPSP